MQDLKSLSTDQLLDLLSLRTADYVKMMRDGGNFASIEYAISMIQSEINFRKSSFSNEEISFTTDVS